MTPLAFEFRETLLKVEGVTKSLGGNVVLRDLNLEVRNIVRPGMTQGQVVGLLGPSGIGKTTFFRILAGLEAPDSGSVRVTEKAVPVQRGMVGVVAQNYPLFAHRRVLSNLEVAGRLSGLSATATREKAMGLLKRFGMEAHAHKYPAQLSGGQRQRVAIAQQFMCSEHFLLMDEPFSGLDLIAKHNVCQFLAEMAAADDLSTFIVVTHDVASAIEVSDTIWLMGRDRDEKGELLPGARIQASYNLMERGLAWHENIASTPEFLELYREISAIFQRL